MKQQDIQTHTFPNGLVLAIEPMTDVQSAAFSLMVPAGCNYDPPNQNGCAAVLSEMMVRGAGLRDARELSSALDNLGVERHESVGNAHLTLSGATLADNLPDVLPLYGDIVLKPHLPDDQFDAARLGVEQSLLALEDEPRQKIFIELRRRCFDVPWGLPSEGTLEGVRELGLDAVRAQYKNCFRPNGAILGIAGNVDPRRIIDTVGDALGDWRPLPDPVWITGPRGKQHDHVHHDSAQTHIGIAYDSVPYRDPAYYEAWAAVSVLSGGMSARLFTEVREKRGLCYAVSASLSSLKDEARVLCYAGTTPERAQQTLDVTLGEIVRLAGAEGPILQDELDRCKARAKSSLIMQQESTISRASSIARDWYHLGRVTTLHEVREKIEALTVNSVTQFVRAHPPRDFVVVTVGPVGLEVPGAIS